MSLLRTISQGQTSVDRIAEKIRSPFDLQLTISEKKQDFAGGFVITPVDLNGQFRFDEQIRLIGNQMPHIPFEGLGGDQRVVKEYYPGNDEASVQVLGPEEPDFSIKGILTDKRLKDPALYGASYELAELIDKYRFEGRLLKLQMGEWVRYGHIKSCRFPMKTLGHLEYQITFSITGFNLPTNRNFLDSIKESPFTINAQLLTELEAQQIANQTKPVAVKQNIFESFSGLFNQYVAGPISAVINFVDAIFDAKKQAEDSVDQIRGLLRSARGNLARFHRQIGANPYKDTSVSVEQEIATANFLATRRSETYKLTDLLVQYEGLIETLKSSIPLRRHLVKQDETLQKLAVQYYNDASLWNKIYEHNDLTTTVLDAGMILEIPRL
jgi:hypothetical protein